MGADYAPQRELTEVQCLRAEAKHFAGRCSTTDAAEPSVLAGGGAWTGAPRGSGIEDAAARCAAGP
eukprot:7853340-Lingulodinium_polyedra.AAC.1